jgi:hypothetical protein
MVQKKIKDYRDKPLSGDVFFNFRYYKDKYYIITLTYRENGQITTDYIYVDSIDDKDCDLLTYFVFKLLTSNPNCRFICFDIKHALKPIIYKHRFLNLYNINVIDIQLLMWLSRVTRYDGININDIYNYTKSDIYKNSKIEKFYKIYQRKDFEYFIPIDIFRQYLIKESEFLFEYYEKNLKVECSDIIESEPFRKYTQFLVALSLIERSPIYFDNEILNKKISVGENVKDFEKLLKHRYLARVNYYYNNISLCHSDYGRLGASKSMCNFFTLNKKHRDVFKPHYDKFLSVDLKANHAFYLFKSLGLLDGVDIDNDFDIYSYIDDFTSLSRAEKKNNINPILFGGNRNSDYTKQFFKKFPKVKEYFDSLESEYQQKNYIVSKVTHKKNSFDTSDRNWLGTMVSFILQNETAYEMFNFVTEIQLEMARNGLKSNIWFILHDEIILDVLDSEINAINSIVKRVVCVPYQSSISDTWNFKD